MTNEKRLQALAELQEDGERMEKSVEEYNAWIDANRKAAFEAGFNKALDLVMEEATDNGWRAVECCDDKDLFVPLSILKAIISKLRGEK